MTTPSHTSFPSSRCEQGRVKLCALIPMQRLGITKLARFGATQPAAQKQIARQIINFRLCPSTRLRISERPCLQMPVSMHICSPLSDPSMRPPNARVLRYRKKSRAFRRNPASAFKSSDFSALQIFTNFPSFSAIFQLLALIWLSAVERIREGSADLSTR